MVALTAGLAAMAALTEKAAQSATSTDAQVVRDGDRVAATGLLIQAPGAPLKLCQGNAMIAIYPAPAPTCSAWAFPIDGAAVPDSVVWLTTDGVRHAEGSYRLTGLWRDGRIEEQALTLVPQEPRPTGDGKWYPSGRFELRCDLPSTWPDKDFQSPAQQAAQRRLSAEVGRHPDRYSGVWGAHPRQGSTIGPDFEPYIISVGTVNDPATEQRRLQEIYPYSLCVHQVPYSARELNAVASRLDIAQPGRTHVAPDLGRLQVELFVLDEAMRERVGDDADAVIVAPFVHKESSSPGTA